MEKFQNSIRIAEKAASQRNIVFFVKTTWQPTNARIRVSIYFRSLSSE